jgi:xanthine dehydrogenase YagS FAD-binding subunit
MQNFTHINPTSISDATSALTQYGSTAAVISGGTDLLGELIVRNHSTQPQYVINLKTITPSMDYITTTSTGVNIGALTLIDEIANSTIIQSGYSVLAQAASKVASWQIRNMGTIGGNICQSVRCWYYRSNAELFNCLRKNPKGQCFALVGDNRWQHSIFGATNGCVAANVSDIAPALIALGASIVTSNRTIAAGSFFNGFTNTVLTAGEIVTEIQIPSQPAGSKQVFEKGTIRRAVDFALASCAMVVGPTTGTITSARIAMGGVATTPMEATAAETALIGQTISSSVASTVAAAAVKGATALTYNKYKIQMIQGLIQRALLS